MLDLENWQNKKYQTRDGQSIRLLCIDGHGECDYQPIVGLDYAGNCLRWNIDGSYHGKAVRSGSDLINAPSEPVTITRWVNVYEDRADCIMWHSERAAKGSANAECAQQIPVTITFTPKACVRESS